MLCRDTQDGQVIVESSDPPGAGTGKPLQYLCQENSMDRNKRLQDMMLKDEPLSLEGIQHVTEEEQRTSSSRANEVVGPKSKGCSAVDTCGSERKSQCCKEKYCIGTWNVRSMDLGKPDVVKQEMARVYIDILRISELK